MNQKGMSLLLTTGLALILLPALFSIFGQAQTAFAATHIVNIFHDEDDGVCDASCSIRDAISEATSGDNITIPAGSHTLSATYGTLTVTKSLIFNGNSATDTFIDAQGNSRVFNITDGTVTFNNLTIQGGNLITGTGGGINAIDTASLILDSTIISGNNTPDNGGGIALTRGSLTLTNSQIMSNTSGHDGGGIYSHQGIVTLNNSQILTNTAERRGGGVALIQPDASLVMNSGQINDNITNNMVSVFPGGAVFVAEGSFIFNDGEIRNNLGNNGGAILLFSGSVTINGGQIIDNEAEYGGGIYVRFITATLTINSGSITQNRAVASTYGGGAIFIFQGGVVIMNGGELSSNTAVNNGGAVEIFDGSFTLNDGDIFSNNTSNMGGAIYNDHGILNINGGTIHSNDSVEGGGAITTNSNSQSTIQNSALLSNTTSITQTGGAINNGGILTMTNVTLSGNSAGSGAGVANSNTAVLNNVTLSENTATTSGGGLSNSSGTLTVSNSIIFGNTAPSNANCNGTVTSAGNNVAGVDCSFGGSGDTTSDPLLQTLALNNGATLNYALGAGSSAIDTGNNANCSATDQRDNLRPIDGDDNGSAICDIGAHEVGIGFFINDVNLTEGDAGNQQMSFIVSRSMTTAATYTVTYATADGTALAGAGLDYTAVPTTTLTFLPATLTQTVNIDILGDTLDEDNELFTVQLGDRSPGTKIGDSSGSGTILDNDTAPTMSINDVILVEGNSGTVTGYFTATLSAPSGKPITVDYDTMDGTAVSPADYNASLGNTLSFTPGDTEKSFSITINGDIAEEGNEAFTVELSNESNVILASSNGQITIIDDDATPTLTIADVNVTEGNSGTSSANFVATLSSPSGKQITVDYTTMDETAVSTEDYIAASNTLTFTPGTMAQTFSIDILGDLIIEFDETFTIELSSGSDVIFADSSEQVIITDDDGYVIYLPIVI
ncbi:MAG: hypothetical protein GY805_33210, partial [Chloroflexi bacterium]|nr:hypothetical protein [Chloroflexota bacterium]